MLEELEFKSAQKWKSENRSIEFKNPIVEKKKVLAEMLANLEQLQTNVVKSFLLKDIDPRLQNISQVSFYLFFLTYVPCVCLSSCVYFLC